MTQTVVIAARISRTIYQKAQLLAQVRGIDRQDIVIQGLIRELDEATPDELLQIAELDPGNGQQLVAPTPPEEQPA